MDAAPPPGSSAGDTPMSHDAALLDGMTRIESMCPNCEENGETILLLHSIPHFKDILIASFSCPHCHYANREVQNTGAIDPQGIHIECRVSTPLDLNRQVVKSEACTVKIREIELEVPPRKGQGELNTIEGLVTTFAENLKFAALKQREQAQPEAAEKLEALVQTLKAMAAGEKPFTLELDDPSGNSYIERIELTASQAPNKKTENGDARGFTKRVSATEEAGFAPSSKLHSLTLSESGSVIVRRYERTKEQLHAMGYFEAQGETSAAPEDSETCEQEGKDEPDAGGLQREQTMENDLREEVIQLPVECPHCGTSTTNNVCQVNIPGFRECLIFAFTCPSCGAKNSEIKAAGAYGLTGRRWILKVEGDEDLNREVLKSDTSTIEIPCLELSMEGGSEAGSLTTVEGMLSSLEKGLSVNIPFASGDSASEASRKRFEEVSDKLKLLQKGDASVLPFILKIQDPADMSFISMRKPRGASEGENPGREISDKDLAGIPQRIGSTHIDGDAVKALVAAGAAAASAPGAGRTEEEITAMLEEAQPGDILWTSKLDEALTVEAYKRTLDEDDTLGLLDMKV